MYRRPPLPDLKPPHAFSGHTFVFISPPPGGGLLRCVNCHEVLAEDELGDLAWCPDALLALEQPSVKHKCEYCKGIVNAAPRHMERVLANHLDSCPAALRYGHKPRSLTGTSEAPRKRIIPRQVL